MEKYRFPEDQRSLLEHMQMPFAMYQFIDRRVVTVVLSEGFCEVFGYDDMAEAYRDMDHDMYKDAHPDDVARIADAAVRFATEGGNYEVIYRTRIKNSDGYKVVHAMGRHVYTESGVRLAHVWYTDEGLYSEEGTSQGFNLSQALNNALHEDSLIRASSYDYLTGLPSMAYFFELAEAGRKAIVQQGGQPVLLYMDLCGMKYYNHKHGFAEGDKLLKAFARLLIETFSNENCCRIGADHFAVFTGETGLEEVLQGIFRKTRELNEGRSMPVRIGVYRDRTGDTSVSTACDRAKLACDKLRNTYVSSRYYYHKGLRDAIEQRQYILANLDRAIGEKWIQVYYQPIVRVVNGQISDDEALSRWVDPVRGILPPEEFVPILEETGQIYKLDLCVLEQVLERLRARQRAGLNTVPQSINLSRSDFDACDMVEEIRRRVDEAGVGRDKITIEITESTIGSDFDFMKKQVERFHQLGFSVWMDDFGSGYSSLDVLQSIHFDLLKFDMGFMQKLDEGGYGRIILTELMKMATALGVDTVCEGVETEEQVCFLREIGCAKLQGFYFSRPAPLDDLLSLCEQGRPIGYEDPEETSYYEAIGQVNLYDLAIFANEEEDAFRHFFDTLPMCIMEVRGSEVRFVRSNRSYRAFLKRFFNLELSDLSTEYISAENGVSTPFMNFVRQCCITGTRAFFDDRMADGAVVHSFARKISVNPVTGTSAVAIAVLSVTDVENGATYANIARALAADYYNLYYVDLDTERFIEYSSPVGGEEMAVERHGEDFFALSKRDAMRRIYEEDREPFIASFTKENVLRVLDEQGVFTAAYRLVDSGTPMYARMKVMRMQPDQKHVVIGVSLVDAQMKQQAKQE